MPLPSSINLITRQRVPRLLYSCSRKLCTPDAPNHESTVTKHTGSTVAVAPEQTEWINMDKSYWMQHFTKLVEKHPQAVEQLKKGRFLEAKEYLSELRRAGEYSPKPGVFIWQMKNIIGDGHPMCFDEESKEAETPVFNDEYWMSHFEALVAKYPCVKEDLVGRRYQVLRKYVSSLKLEGKYAPNTGLFIRQMVAILTDGKPFPYTQIEKQSLPVNKQLSNHTDLMEKAESLPSAEAAHLYNDAIRSALQNENTSIVVTEQEVDRWVKQYHKKKLDMELPEDGYGEDIRYAPN